MALDTTTKAYQGLTKTINKNGHTITEKYVGSKEACEGFLSGYSIGDIGPLGSLQTMNFGQDEGPVWYAELEWGIEYDTEGNPQPAGDNYGPKQSSLNVRMLSLPLENRTNYHTNWNHALIGLGTDTVPDWWATASDLVISGDTDFKIYRWIKEASEIPLEKTDGKSWKMLREKTMPGVESYDFPIYELTESSKHTSQDNARLGYC